MMHRVLSILAIAALFAPSLAIPSHAQQKTVPAAKTKAGAKSKTAPDWKTTTATPSPSKDAALGMLIHRTLLTLNDANLSGNYTVLRDLAAPRFRKANDSAKLAAIFAKLRNRKIDMAPVAYVAPKLVRKPQITKRGLLHLTGFVPTRPQQINFDMLFAKGTKRWLLFSISVNVAPPKTAATTPKDTAGKKAPKKTSK